MADITIAGATFNDVPSILIPAQGGGNAQFYDMSDPMSFLGKDVECLNDNLYFAEYKLADTAFSGWTPSSTALICVASVTQSAKFQAADMDNYEYYICWDCGVDIVYNGTGTGKAQPVTSRAFLVQEIFRRPGSSTAIKAENYNTNVCNTAFTGSWLRYYNASGSLTYTWAVSYGFYWTLVASTFSSTTSDNPNVNLKTPTLSTRTNSSYMVAANANAIDQDASKCWIKGKLYRVKRNGFLRGVYENVVRIINDDPPYTT